MFLKLILYPFSICYGLTMTVRNLLFDWGILHSEKFDRAVISIGNLSVGGTGKTPMIEYLIRLLQPTDLLATLSRGYGRKSDGFLIVSKRTNVKYSGDEPLQIAKKFEEVKVAVDENRKRGISLLLEKYPDLNVILLDDAFQHRYVKPGISLLLTDYHNMYTEDRVIPSGTLREFTQGASRADLIVVTKTPKLFSPITRRRILEDIGPKSHQQVVFSYFQYGEFQPFFESADFELPQKFSTLFLFTGIANDSPLQEHLERMCTELISVKFPDHHQYSIRDMESLVKKFNDLPTQKKIMITTEKDRMRLKIPELSNILKKLPLFYLPVQIEFHGHDKELFTNYILNYVATTKRNRRVS